MFNLKDKNNQETILDELFECREPNLYALTEEDKKKIANLTKNNDSYEKLFETIQVLSTDAKKLESVKNSLDSYIDRITISSSYENEKFYKYGFADAINLVLACTNK